MESGKQKMKGEQKILFLPSIFHFPLIRLLDCLQNFRIVWRK